MVKRIWGNRRRIAACLFCAILCGALLTGCVTESRTPTTLNNASPMREVRIAYRAVGDDITEVFAYKTHTLVAANDERLCYLVVQRVLADPKSEDMVNAAPSHTAVRGVDVSENGIITVELSRTYGTLTGIRRTIADYCIALSLFGLETVYDHEIASVILQVEDEPGNTVLHREDVVDSTDFLRLREYDLTIWFPNVETGKLESEVFHRTLSDAESTAETVVDILMSGRRSDGRYQKLMTSNTKLLSLEVRNRVCFLNFNKGFLDVENCLELGGELLLFAFVNTLCELDYIDRVQFLIDGEVTKSGFYEDFDEPYSANAGLAK